MIRYPRSLGRGAVIGVTGPSGGVEPRFHARLELALEHARARGDVPREGRCLREQHKHVSASRENRARDFVELWHDPDVDAIIPPWGGELLVEILPLLDFPRLAEGEPKWVMGYSDTSTLLLPLTLLTGIATAHGSNLMDQIPAQSDPLTAGCLEPLRLAPGASFRQESSARHQAKWTDLVKEPARPFDLTEETRWKILGGSTRGVSFSGRLIGGCLDTIVCLAGTPYGDVPAFAARYARDGVVLYLENCEMAPCALSRALWNLRLAGWFDAVAGVVLGRSTGPDAKKPDHLTYEEALASVLGDLGVPVVYDADVGHKPPQMTLVNGALARVEASDGRGAITQTLA